MTTQEKLKEAVKGYEDRRIQLNDMDNEQLIAEIDRLDSAAIRIIARVNGYMIESAPPEFRKKFINRLKEIKVAKEY